MLFDIILLVIAVLFLCLYVKQIAQIKLLKMKIQETEQRGSKHDEFSLGLTKLNSDFIGEISLDPLTKLPRREAFEDRLLQALNQSKRFHKSFAIILLDIQAFHVINEEHGYEMGDKLLREIAKRLQSAIRQIDTMTRYAGNTFIFLLPQLSLPETAAYVAQRLLDHIVQPFQIDEKKLYVNASVGVVIYPNDGGDKETLLLNANKALLEAKSTGGGRYQFYQQEMHALSLREVKINSFFNRSDFITSMLIYYQPQINVTHNEVMCVQAIPYLHLPDIGLLAYSDFEKIADNNEKTIQIGEWLLRNAVIQFKKWDTEGFRPAMLSMNTTLRQLEDPLFMTKVENILQELKMDPSKVIFEISGESLLSTNPSLENTFTRLTQIGIQISISICALGNFALQKITKLPIHYLKIDSKLIRDRKLHEENKVLLHVISTLAKDMNVNIIAEGVENEKQKDQLQELGCVIMQGQLFGQPLPVEAMVKQL